MPTEPEKGEKFGNPCVWLRPVYGQYTGAVQALEHTSAIQVWPSHFPCAASLAKPSQDDGSQDMCNYSFPPISSATSSMSSAFSFVNGRGMSCMRRHTLTCAVCMTTYTDHMQSNTTVRTGGDAPIKRQTLDHQSGLQSSLCGACLDLLICRGLGWLHAAASPASSPWVPTTGRCG